jgi:hypothetical protein
MFQEAVKSLHHLDDCNILATVHELMIRVCGVGPAPRVGEGVELCLAYLPARLAKEDVVISVRVKRRIEIDKIDARVGKFFPIGKLFQVIAKVQSIHSGKRPEIPRLRSE